MNKSLRNIFHLAAPQPGWAIYLVLSLAERHQQLISLVLINEVKASETHQHLDLRWIGDRIMPIVKIGAVDMGQWTMLLFSYPLTDQFWIPAGLPNMTGFPPVQEMILIMASLNLSLLGPFVASVDGRPITNFRTKATQALLIYLACQPEQAHRRDHLMTLLAPGLPKKSAQANLRQTLYQLRQVLSATAVTDDDSAPFLLSDWQTIQINSEAVCKVDVLTFESAIQAGEAHWAAAVELYRGDFLVDFYLPGSSAFEAWVEAKRQAYRHQALEALERLTAVAIRRTDYAKACIYAEKQLAIDNLRENAYRQLMEILARNGRRRAAISQYELLAQLLHDELAIEPTASTQALHEAIRSGEFEETAASPPPAPIAAAPKRPKNNHNLPTQTTPFFGREAELRTLNEFMTDQGVRLVTIVGPGGMGKTRLALEAARQQLDNFDHGVWFSSMAKLSLPDEIVPATAQALHFNFYEGGTPRQQLLDYLRNKSLLLIFDNYEHLLDGADLVTDVLKNDLQVNVLVTSREPLRLVEEQLFPLSGLAFSPEKISEADEAVQFFLERARHLRPDLTLKADDMTHITTICRQVEGMPLGLELAATWVDTLSLAEIAAELQENLDLLESDMRNIADRHRSIRAVFEASWDRLQPNEQQLFAQLSVFRGGFTRTAAKEICAPDLSQPPFHRLLATLTRKSFLKYDMENGRYDIHELMRQFGAEKLAQSPNLKETIKNHHSSYYCAFLQKQDAKLKGPQQKEAVAEIEIEHENARLAWEWAVEQKRLAWLDQALDGLCRFYEWQGLYQEVEPTCQLASEKLIRSVSGDGLRVLARILAWQGRFLANHSADRQLLQQGLSLLEKPELNEYDTRAEQAFALLRMGPLVADRKETMRLLNQSLSLYRELGDHWSEATVLYRSAGVVSNDSGAGRAEEWAEKSLVIRQNLGDQLGTAISLRQLAIFAREQGQTEKSESLNQQSLSLGRALNNQPLIVRGLLNMALLKEKCGQFVECQVLLKEQIKIANNLGMHFNVALAYVNLSLAAIHLGNYTKARDYLAISRSINLELNSLKLQGLNITVLCMIELAEEKYIEARKLCQKGLTIFQKEDVYMIGLELAYLAYAEQGLNNLDASRKYVVEALNLTIKSGALMVLMETLPAATLLLANQGKKERAIEIYSLATRSPKVANSQWFEDIAGRHIKAAAASLPPERVKAAEERGQTHDFWETAVSLLAKLSEPV